MKLVYTKKARINTVQTRGLGFRLIMHERTNDHSTYILYRTGGAKGIEGGTVCSNGFYADISNQHQMQHYKSCLKSFLQNFSSFEVP